MGVERAATAAADARRCTARIDNVKITERVVTATCDPGTADSVS